jgi:hypothetical protein
MTDHALKLVMASFTYAKGNEVNASAVALEEYLLNNTIYLKLDGNWTVLRLPAAAEAWSQQNTMEQQVNMLNQSDLTLMGAETVEGQNCYKVRAKIDMLAYTGQLSSEVASYLPMTSANSTDLFRNMTLDVYYWITKDAHLLKKTVVHEVINVTPQSLGLQATGQEIRVNSTTTMIFEGFNESVNIVLPSVAGRAQPFPQAPAASHEAVSVASNGSEIGPNESMSDAARLSESIPNTTKLDESKSRLNESVSRLNKSMPYAARLNETISIATLSNATLSNATLSNATLPNASMQEKRTIPAASTPWRIFL